MFTCNFQYISKAKLADTFEQLRIDSMQGDILIRIHTAIHSKDEAVELARYIKNIIPKAHIVGTSTSGVICWGKLLGHQCIISVTWMNEARVKAVMLPAFDEDSGQPVRAETLCENMRDAVVSDDTRMLLTFMTRKYYDVYRFIELCNDYFPGVQMTGGLANTGLLESGSHHTAGFLFNETGASDNGIIAASISGEVNCMCSYANGVQVIGKDITITDSFGPFALEYDGKDAASCYRMEVGDEITADSRLSYLFPYVYSDEDDIPILFSFYKESSLAELFPPDDPQYKEEYEKRPDLDPYAKRDLIVFKHNVETGKKIKRALIYDRKIIDDNRALFRKVENFDYAETLFGYSGMASTMLYSNCVKWELSAYANSNMCGCITEGQIAYVNGHNVFANCSFVVTLMGENHFTQQYNPYALAHTDSLADDNRKLLDYLMSIERRVENSTDTDAAAIMRSFIRDCEHKLLYVDEDLPNSAAMFADIKQKGLDRICLIDVTDTTAIKTVFPDYLIKLTYSNYVLKCVSFAQERRYRLYKLENWRIAISTPSYMTSLSRFVSDMEWLQKILFSSSEEFISIVPMFCVIDDFTAESLSFSYNSAQLHMMQRNTQFYVHDAHSDRLDEDAIRFKYMMVNVINYAISHDKIIPYYQGIYDNKAGKIHHYESLMRIEDENGKVYSPAAFLDVARSFGLLYDSISKQMIRKVFNRFRDSAECSVSVNLSMRDIRSRELTSYIYDFLSTAPHPENFVFEILENEAVDDYDILVGFVYRIHSLGGRISIDDFGSGYSNLLHITSIQSDYIKIDGSIIRTCCDDTGSESLIALISGWKALSSRPVEIIAEYVENENIQRMLLEYDIDYSQGYLFSKPSPDIDIVAAE